MKLREKGWLNRKLYFVKVDIQSAFDTIPQAKLLQVVENLITEEQYKIIRYTEVTATDNYADRASNSSLGGTQFKMFRKFHSEAKDSEDYEKFEDMARRKSQRGKKGIIYVDKVNHTVQDRDYLLNMLKEHVLQNFTKVCKPKSLMN